MRQLLLFSLSSQKNYKFIYSFFGGLQIHRTSAATDVWRGVRRICNPPHSPSSTARQSNTHSTVDCKSTEHPPQRGISISRCDNYCCFPYHLKRITNSNTHFSVDCNCFSLRPATVGSTEHPLHRVEPTVATAYNTTRAYTAIVSSYHAAYAC